jgi:replicative DNA helicase
MKVPPKSEEFEMAVLGACMIERDAFNTASEFLKPEMLYVKKHQDIFRTIEKLSLRGSAIDIMTVSSEMKADKELTYYISSLTNYVVSSAHIISHCRKIVEFYLLRECIRIGGELYKLGFDQLTDPFELIENSSKQLHELTQAINSREALKIDNVLVSIVQDLEEKRHRKKHITGHTTGFEKLDVVTCGWQDTDLIILAARPKCGKTAFALNLGLNASLDGTGVCYYSMEMSSKQLVNRILANSSSMYLQSLRDAKLDDEQMVHLFESGVKRLAGLNFFVDDTAALSVSDFKARARRMVKKDGVGLIIVDYLQLFQRDRSMKNQNREQEVSHNARQLKITAKELSVPIIALSQLSREIEKRGSHVPQLSDLRESGAIEQDADMVMFLYKPEPENESKINLKIAAFRNGIPQTLPFNFKGEFQRFEESNDFVSKETPSNWKPLREEETFPTF